MIKTRIIYATVFLVVVLIVLLSNNFLVSADQRTDELKSKINQRTADIQVLESEIKEFQKQIDILNGQAVTLSSTIKSLELTQKKLEADIAVTVKKIDAKNLEIKNLSNKIQEKEGDIADNKRIITKSITTLNQLDNRNVTEILLSSQSISETLNDMDNLGVLQKNLQDKVANLRQIKTNLEINKNSTEKARYELTQLQKQLSDQKKIVVGTVSEKNSLLRQTKQSESSYKKILAEKQAQKDAFEKEIFAFESQLKLNVDSSKLPHTGSGILSWPLDNIRITQYFGNTKFSTNNPQIYKSGTHNGVDFAASIGTPVKAALNGTVVGVGNTDLVRTCQSYGKWVMIRHDNGLSTLYAHLSLQTVSTGQRINTGEIIGYSGNTGASTGPHLHFGVYATDGVQVTTLSRSVSRNCAGTLFPAATFQAYLNPLSYL